MIKLITNHRPLVGLLVVQLLTGIILTPLNNFGSIYLNEGLAFSLPDVSLVIALGQIMGMVASVISGSLNDRLGYRVPLLIGVVGLTISTLLFLTKVPWLVIVLWCFISAGNGFAAVSGQGYLVLMSSSAVLGLASALYNWGYTVGGVIGTPLATLVLGEDNFTALGYSLVILSLVMVLVASLLPRSQTADDSQSSDVTTTGYGVLLNRHIIILIMLRFLPTCYYGVMTLMPLLIKQQSDSNTVVAWYIAISSIFASLTQLLAGRVADKIGVRLPTQVAFGFILLSIVGMIFTAHMLWGLFVFGTIGIGAAWALSTLLPGLVITAAEPGIRGRVFGMLHVLWTIAMAFGTLLGGNLIEVNIQLPFMIVGVLNIIALGLTVPFFQMGKARQFAV